MTTVPAWIPKFTHGSILDLVAKRSTGWVDVESRKVYASRGSRWSKFKLPAMSALKGPIVRSSE